MKQSGLALPNSLKEIPGTEKDRHQLDNRTIAGLKQGILALSNSPGGKHGESISVRKSPLTKNRHQLDNKTDEALKQGILALPISSGVRERGDHVHVRESQKTKNVRHQLDNRTIETLNQSFQALCNSPEEKGGHGSSQEKGRTDTSSTRKRMCPVFFQEGQGNRNVGHQQESMMGVEGRMQNLALPNSTARLARRNSLPQGFGSP